MKSGSLNTILRAIVCLIAVLTNIQLSAQYSNIRTDNEISIDNTVNQQITAQNIVGLSIGIIKNGEIVYLKGYGQMDRENSVPATDQTLYRIASVSKPITGLLSMILAEQGKLDLNKNIRDYVPEYPIKPEGTITSHHLLSNQSGIIHYAGTSSGQYCSSPYDVNYVISYSDAHTDYYDPIDALNVFKNQPICFTPGQHYQYSTWGFCLMGAVLERAYGDEFENLVYRELVLPLSLPRFQPEFSAFDYANETKGYRISSGSAIPTPTNDLDYDRVSYKIPGGGFVATVADMALIIKGIVNEEILSKTYVDLFGNPNIPQDGVASNYGYGIGSVRSGGNRVYNHGGSQAKAESFILFSPDNKNGVVVLTNTQGASLSTLASSLYNYIPNIVAGSNSFVIPQRDLAKITNERNVTICTGESFEGKTESGIYITNTTDSQNRKVKDVLRLTVNQCGMLFDTKIDFETSVVSIPQTKTITITNTTGITQNVTITNLPAGLTTDITSFSMAPDEVKNIAFTFNPSAVGNVQSTFNIEFSDWTNGTIDILANVILHENLKVMTFNILEGGKNGLDKIFAVIQEHDPDIVFIQEGATNQTFKDFATSAGYNFYVNTKLRNTSVLSKFPILSGEENFASTDTKIQLTQDITLSAHSIHLPCCEQQTERDYAMRHLVSSYFRTAIEEGPLLLGGDFNVDNYDTQVLSQLSYLGLNKDADNNWLDYIYSYGLQSIPETKKIIGGYEGWPSDHNAVYVEYVWPSQKIIPESKSQVIKTQPNTDIQFSSTTFTDHFFKGDLGSVVIKKLPTKGFLVLGNVIVQQGASIPVDQLNNLKIRFLTTGISEFEWLGYDTNGNPARTSSWVQVQSLDNIQSIPLDKAYFDIGTVQVGRPLYFGNNNTIAEASPELIGAEYLRTPTYIRYMYAQNYPDLFKMDLANNSDVYIAYDDRYVGKAPWLTDNYTETPLVFKSNNFTYKVFKRKANPGEFQFGTHEWIDWNYRTIVNSWIVIVKARKVTHDAQISFGNLNSGYEKTKKFLISNTSDFVQNVTIQNIPNGLSFDQTSFTLQVDQSIELEAKLNVIDLGNYSSTFTLDFDNFPDASVPVTAVVDCFKPRGGTYDFNENDVTAWYNWGGYTISHESGKVKIDVTKDANYDGFGVNIDEVDLSANPNVTIKFQSSANMVFRVDLQDNQGRWTNAEPVAFTYFTGDGLRTVNLNFSGKFNQNHPTTDVVDPSKINAILFYPAPGGTFQGTIHIDEIIIGDGLNEKEFYNELRLCPGETYNYGNQVISQAGEYAASFISSVGCDSLSRINVIYEQEYTRAETRTICSGDQFIFGTQTLTQSGNFSELFQTVHGCDSTVNLALTVDLIAPIVSLNGEVLSVTTSQGASYAWVDCDNNNSLVAGATSSTFAPRRSGNYAARVTRNGCEFYSDCAAVTVIILGNELRNEEINIYPNPSSDGLFQVSFQKQFSGHMEIMDLSGRLVHDEILQNKTEHSIQLAEEYGIYVVKLSDKSGSSTYTRIMIK